MQTLLICQEIALGGLPDGIALQAFHGKGPFSGKDLERVRDLSNICLLECERRASHRLRETPPWRKSKAKP